MASLPKKTIYDSKQTEALAIIMGHFAETLKDTQKSDIAVKIGTLSNLVGNDGDEQLSKALHEIGEEILNQKIHLNLPPPSEPETPPKRG